MEIHIDKRFSVAFPIWNSLKHGDALPYSHYKCPQKSRGIGIERETLASHDFYH
jgi:hypothetical protein